MLLTLMVAGAWASPGYPGEITSYEGLACTPQCTICHETNAGGSGTVSRDFGGAMESAGLTGGSDYAALDAALDTLDGDGTDSDGDGVTDLDELRAGTDPNPGGAAFCDVVTPTYGCFNTAQAVPSMWGLLGAVAGVFAVKRRR